MCLYITNRPALAKSVDTVPSISDHGGAIVVDSNILAVLNEKMPMKACIFSKAQWNSMKTDETNVYISFPSGVRPNLLIIIRMI